MSYFSVLYTHSRKGFVKIMFENLVQSHYTNYFRIIFIISEQKFLVITKKINPTALILTYRAKQAMLIRTIIQ